MTPLADRLSELREKAKKATWGYTDDADAVVLMHVTREDRAFIDAARPDVVDALAAVAQAGEEIAAGEKCGFVILPAPLEAYERMDAALAHLDSLLTAGDTVKGEGK